MIQVHFISVKVILYYGQFDNFRIRDFLTLNRVTLTPT